MHRFYGRSTKIGSRKALETLLAYNCQDTVNLETLMVMAYNLKLKDTPFREMHKLELPVMPPIPYQSRPGDGGQSQEHGGMVVGILDQGRNAFVNSFCTEQI